MAQYGTLITNIGLAQIANAQITQSKVGLEYIALGDGNGAHYVPTQNQTALVHEVWRGPISELSIDPTNDNRIVIDAVIPVTAGGFTIREIGIFDDKNQLIAVGQYPEKYKPQLSEGVSEETIIHFVIETNNADVVKLTVDPTVIIASRPYVDSKVAQVQTEFNKHKAEIATTEKPGHVMLVNDLITGGTDKAASAETVKTLNTNQTNHTNNTGIHVTPEKQTSWNNKLDKTGGTITGSLTVTNTLIVDGVDLKHSVSDLKSKVAAATTDMGVQTSPTATGDQIAANIRAIRTGVPYWSGTVVYAGYRAFTFVNGTPTNIAHVQFTLPFNPKVVAMMGYPNTTVSEHSIYDITFDGNYSGTVKVATFSTTEYSDATTRNYRGDIVNNGNGTFTVYMPVMFASGSYKVQAFG